MAIRTYGPNAVDWEQRVDLDRLREQRLARLKEALEQSSLGALLTFAPQPLYAPYVAAPRLWGTTAIGDQQLGGLIMWLPTNIPEWKRPLASCVTDFFSNFWKPTCLLTKQRTLGSTRSSPVTRSTIRPRRF